MSKKLKITRSSGNIFADIGFDKDEAENLKLRAELMMRIEDRFRKSGVPQAAMARGPGPDDTAPQCAAQGKDRPFQPGRAGQHRHPRRAERAASREESGVMATRPKATKEARRAPLIRLLAARIAEDILGEPTDATPALPCLDLTKRENAMGKEPDTKN